MTTQLNVCDAPTPAVWGEPTSVSPAPLPAAPLTSGHIPALDAVRGIAILMVTAFRFFPAYDDPSLAGRLGFRILDHGSRGVDLFFVLSGFLITGILWDAKSKLHFFRNFYARRALRIFPLYYAALFLMLIVLPAFGLARSTEFTDGERYSGWLWTYGTNIIIAWEGDWCLGAYSHFWSLAVEEHFYLIWPLFIFLLSRPNAIKLCIAAIVFSLVTRALWLYGGGSDVGMRVLTPFRIDALALGGLIALVARGPSDLKSWRPWAIVGCIVIFVALLPPLELQKRLPALRETLYAFFFAGVILVALTTARTGWWGRLWSLPILRFFGKYSYGMYVVQNFLKAAVPPELVIASVAAAVGSIFWGRCTYLVVMSIATVVAALLSWHLLEKHFLRMKSTFE